MSGSPLYDRDQLQPEDTLVPEPTGDVLDSGYEPPDSSRGLELDKSVAEEDEPETIEARLAQEEPEDPELPGQPVRPRPGSEEDAVDEELVADPDEPAGSDLFADGDGPLIDGTPEEEAMHVIEGDEAP